MATTAPELRSEIEYRREAIDRDLNELGDKVSPSKAVKRTADRTVSGTKRRWSSLKDSVMGSSGSVEDRAGDVTSSVGDTVTEGVEGARESIQRQTSGSPLGAGLAAFGLGLVVAAAWPSIEQERRAASAVEERAGDKVREAARAEGEALRGELEEPAREAVDHVRERASEAAQSVAGSESPSATPPTGTQGTTRAF